MQRPSKCSKFLTECENIFGEERGDEWEKKWGGLMRGEKEANLDLRPCFVPQCGRRINCEPMSPQFRAPSTELMHDGSGENGFPIYVALDYITLKGWGNLVSATVKLTYSWFLKDFVSSVVARRLFSGLGKLCFGWFSLNAVVWVVEQG